MEKLTRDQRIKFIYNEAKTWIGSEVLAKWQGRKFAEGMLCPVCGGSETLQSTRKGFLCKTKHCKYHKHVLPLAEWGMLVAEKSFDLNERLKKENKRGA